MNLDIGVIRRDEIPVQCAPPSVTTTEAFAGALEQRYTPRAVIASRADLALAWEPPAQIDYFYNSPRIEISPTVTVEERYVFAGLAKDLRHVPKTAVRYGEAEAGALFERLFSRHMRVAPFDPPHETAWWREPVRPGAATPPPRLGTVERIVPRAMTVEKSSAAADKTAVITPAARATRWETATPITSPAATDKSWGTAAPIASLAEHDMGWGTPFAFSETSKPLILPAPEIKRVAEQVMREIDRRVVARRERIGRR
jgi:hypothetical protein